MLERIAQEEEKRKQKEKSARLGGIVKKVAIGGAFIGALTAGTVKYGQYTVQHDKKIMNDYDAELNKKIGKEDALRELTNDPRSGYVDLNHYLEDYPEVLENPKKFNEMKEYFEDRDKK